VIAIRRRNTGAQSLEKKMTATFIINTHRSWMPGVGLFQEMLQLLAQELLPHDPDLSKRFGDQAEWSHYESIKDLPEDQFRLVLDAIANINTRLLATWPFEEHRNGYVVLQVLGELETVLMLDSRSPEFKRLGKGTIIVNADSTWNAPLCEYQHVQRLLLAWTKHNKNHILASTLTENFEQRSRVIDVSPLKSEQFQKLFFAVKDIYGRYYEGRVLVTHCDPFINPFAQNITRLFEMFRTDSRIEDTVDEHLGST
jgi:hypothetical protein